MSTLKFVGAAVAAVALAGTADAQFVTYGPSVVYTQPGTVFAPRAAFGPGYYGGGYRPAYGYNQGFRSYNSGYYNGYYGGNRGYYGGNRGYYGNGYGSNYGRRGGVSFGVTFR